MSKSIQDAAVEAESEMESEEVDSSAEVKTDQNAEGAEQTAQADSVEAPSKAERDIFKELESFKLPEDVVKELREYKDGYLRQSDYTKKTQELSAKRKDLEVYENVIKPRLIQDPKLQAAIFGTGQPEAEATDQPEYPEDPKEYAEWVIQEAQNRMRSEQAYENDLQQASQMDTRLNDEKFAKVIAGIVAQDGDYTGGRKTAVAATQEAIAYWDNYKESILSEARNSFVQKAKDKRMVFPSGGSPVATQTARPKTIQEAAAMAEEELSS